MQLYCLRALLVQLFLACLCQPLLQEARTENLQSPAGHVKTLEEKLVSSGAMDLDIKLQRPRDAGNQLAKKLKHGTDRNEWLESARVAAIAGSCPRSHASAISGIKFYAWFALNILQQRGHLLPPSIESLLAWSRLFRNAQTFGNYVSYVKLACELTGVALDVFSHPSLRRAKEAVRKRRLVAPRPPTWIGHDLVCRLLALVLERPELKELLMVFLTSYIFLLRVPSECLPLCCHFAPAGVEAPVFKLSDDEVVLHLPRRKNKLHATRIVRRCWCSKSQLTCPVHMLGAYMRELPGGARPFLHLKPAQTLLALRELLCELNVEDAMCYRLHDFRRGHANDIWKVGGTLADILSAGDWSSAAFQTYLDRCQLESARVSAAHSGSERPAAPSDSEEGISDDDNS